LYDFISFEFKDYSVKNFLGLENALINDHKKKSLVSTNLKKT